MISGYDDWKTTPPEPDPVAHCDCCGCDLYDGDYIYDIDGESICEECLNFNYRRML